MRASFDAWPVARGVFRPSATWSGAATGSGAFDACGEA